LAPRKVVTWDKVQRIYRNSEIWKKKDSIVHRLPDHYKRRYWQNILHDRRPVHYQPPTVRYEWDPVKNIRVENEHYPILPLHPPEADKGLWGGEGVVKGWYLGEPQKKIPRRPRYWTPFYKYPQLYKRVYYSEILDRWMLIWVTPTAHRLIDENQGIDFYLLRTPDIELDSKLGSKLKRELYISLSRGADFHQGEKEKKYIVEKYAEFVLPESEAEWVSLDLNEAAKKQQDIEEAKTGDPTPLKVQFEKELISKLKDGSADIKPSKEEPGAVSRLTSKFWNTLTLRKSDAPKA